MASPLAQFGARRDEAEPPRAARRAVGQNRAVEDLRGVRLVATDLDGTLLRTDGTVSPRTAKAVEAVSAAGVEVVIVTARPPRWVTEIAGSLRCHRLVVCSNGGLIFDAAAGAVVAEHAIPRSSALQIVRRLRTLLAGVALAVEAGTGTGYEPHYLGTWARPDDALVARAEELLEQPACKLVLRHEEPGDHWAVVARVREAVGGLGEVTSSGPEAPIEIAAPGVSKALALGSVAARLGVAPAAVLAFGDMPNDLSMLAWAGRAVAPSNAHPEVLAAAGRVTADCDHDGVAAVLEELVAHRARRAAARARSRVGPTGRPPGEA